MRAANRLVLPSLDFSCSDDIRIARFPFYFREEPLVSEGG
jgi:hypothetical protein